MATYTLSIEDREGPDCTERAVVVVGTNNTSLYVESKKTVVSFNSIDFIAEKVYNPNAEGRPFNHERSEFDTSFSPVHALRDVALATARHAMDYHHGRPVMKYDRSIHDAQRALFEKIIYQEYEALPKPKMEDQKNVPANESLGIQDEAVENSCTD